MDCPHIPEDSLRELGLSLREGPRKPYSAMLEITARCNNRCRHCYIVPPSGAPQPEPDLPFEFWDELMDVLVGEECLWLSLTGGEPMLRPDFPAIYRASRRKGLLTSILTNACLVTDEIADMMVEYPVRGVSVSIYGATAETYETVTQTPGSFGAAMAGIERLLERELPVDLKTMVLRSNVHELDQMKDLADGLGVTFRFDCAINPGIDRSTTPYDERLPPEDAVRIEMSDDAVRAAWAEMWAQVGEVHSEQLYACLAGRHSVFIDARGMASGCLLDRPDTWPLNRGNLLADFREVFYNHMQTRYIETRASGPCRDCGLVVLCPACAAWRRLEGGDGQEASAYGCAIARGRAARLGVVRGGPHAQ